MDTRSGACGQRHGGLLTESNWNQEPFQIVCSVAQAPSLERIGVEDVEFSIRPSQNADDRETLQP